MVDDADRAGADLLATVRELPGSQRLILATATDAESLAELEPGGVLHLRRLGVRGHRRDRRPLRTGQAAENVPVDWLLGARRTAYRAASTISRASGPGARRRSA